MPGIEKQTRQKAPIQAMCVCVYIYQPCDLLRGVSLSLQKITKKSISILILKFFNMFRCGHASKLL